MCSAVSPVRRRSPLCQNGDDEQASLWPRSLSLLRLATAGAGRELAMSDVSPPGGDRQSLATTAGGRHRVRIDMACILGAHPPRPGRRLPRRCCCATKQAVSTLRTRMWRGDAFFPLQLVIAPSSRATASPHEPDQFTGGEFLFCDQPQRRPSDRTLIPAGLGDAILFCTRARLVRVGETYGLQPVQHGLNEVKSGLRYALGIPLHELR